MRTALAVLAVALAVPGFASAATLSPADRAAIDATLNVFVPAAIGRVHSERAWQLSTGSMKSGSTLADWRQGLLPVQPLPVIGKRFHGWTVDSVGKDRADIVLLVHLRKGNDLGLGGVSFDLGMRKVGGRWLVDSAVVAATFAATGTPSKILAANDYGPGSSPDPYSNVKGGLHSQISGGWIFAVAGAFIGLLVLVLLGILLLRRRRDRSPVSDERRARVFRTSE